MERTEAITIFENERCRKIHAMQHRPQIFFQKDNICAGKPNLENIKIVSADVVWPANRRTDYDLVQFDYIFRTENKRSFTDLHRRGNR